MTLTVERLARLTPAKRRLLFEHVERSRKSTPGAPERAEPKRAGAEPSAFHLSEEDRAELDRQHRGRPDVHVDDVYPLSPLQQGMLFHSLLAPGSGEYVQHLSVDFTGPLEVSALRRAWERIVHRHPTLRTAFFWQGLREPLQVVYREVELPWKEDDWRCLSPEEIADRLERERLADLRRGFDLDRAPLLRIRLIRTGDERRRLVWSSHHLLLDGWSGGVVLTEAFSLYEAIRRGRDLVLEERRPYRDYIAWLHDRDSSGTTAAAFWRRTLAGMTPTLLGEPQERRPAVSEPESYRLDRHRLPDPARRALRALGVRHALTLNTLFQGAWSLLLARYAAAEDVVFGVTVSGRSAAPSWVERMVGLFINTLPLRVRLSPESPVLPWLRQLQAAQSELLEYEDTPLGKVREWSDLPAEQPLFDHILIFDSYESASPAGRLSGVEVSRLRNFERTNYSLAVSVVPGADIEVRLGHDLRFFDATTVRRLGGHLRSLLDELVARSAGALGELSMLTPAERQQLLAEWNDSRQERTPADVGAGRLVPLFEAQAARTPESTALVFEAATLSFGELGRRSAGLARRLRRLGVGPEVVVGVFVERSPDLVAAILGVLRAGGAYLPLDPDYPRRRLAFMLEHSGAPVLVAHRRLGRPLARPKNGPRTVWLDGDPDSEVRGVHAGDLHEAAPSPDNLAYVIYTSGSTGQPKGVQISHRALANFLLSMAREPGLTPRDTLVAVTSTSFDISALELFLPLILGARTVLVNRRAAADGAALATRLARSRATVMQATPATWRMLIAAGWQGSPQLAALCGGESLPPVLAEELLGRARTVWNLYGPTETTVWSTVRRLPGSIPVTVGRPVANTGIHVVSPRGRPVPVAVRGEVLIGGAGLARGYHRRPSRTALGFIPDPLGREPGARLYRTGDLGRWRPEGALEILGRIDHQVKVRGHRIELGEVAAVLERLPAVAAAVVTVDADQAGEARLVAYLVPVSGARLPAPERLRKLAGEALPEPMVPSFYQVLDALPLTPSGKVDRRALPVPRKLTGGAGFVAPRTPVEQLLAGIWTELLEQPRVGVRDSFFALGGHSLLATRVVSRIREHLGVELPVRELFANPLLADLAASVERLREQAPGTELPPLAPGSRDGELPLSFAQERLWFLDQLEPGSPAYNLPGALRLRGRLLQPRLRAVLGEIVRRHEVLRTSFPRRRGRGVQVIGPRAELPVPVVDLGRLAVRKCEAEARKLAAAESRRPFDLARGPLLRATVLRLAPAAPDLEEHVVFLSLHHIVADGWSMGILVRELAAHWNRVGAERTAAPLPELAVQYADFALWQRRWLSQEVQRQELSWWRERLEGASGVLELPTDRPRPAVPRAWGATETLRLPRDLGEGLEAFSRRRGVTFFMTLLGALNVLLWRAAGRRDLLVGTPVANRRRVELEALIGCFVNTLVMRCQVAGRLTFARLLSQVKEVTLSAYAHQDLPFETLVDELRPERDLSRTPLFQVMLTLQNTPVEKLEVGGLSLTPWPIETSTAKFDLELLVSDAASGPEVTAEYDRHLFDPTSVRRLLEQWRRLLAGAMNDPARALAALEVLGAAASQQLLLEWNDTARSWREPGRGFTELFEQRAARIPEATAVVCGGARLTYRFLSGRAERLAARLARRGVGPEGVVALLAERGTDLLTAVLAVLRAGGAYLPLDPRHPRRRHREILERSRACLLLVSRRLAAEPASGAGGLKTGTAPVRVLEDLLQEEARPRASFRDGSPDRLQAGTPSHVAYVMYTSGSTGSPKGAMVERRGMVNHLWAKIRDLELGAADRVAQNASQCFDISVWQLLAALAVGGQVVIYPDEVAHDPAELLAAVARDRVSILEVVPSMMQMMVRDERRAAPPLPCLRWLIPTGEAMPPELCRRWQRAYPRIPLLNAYGPTECSDDVSHHALRAPIDRAATTVPVGRPVDRMRLYVLSPDLVAAPAGCAGELCVAGEGVGRGYQQDPRRTASAFVPDPFAAGGRLYRTGDLARARSSGELEFLGRIDHQVKLRGLRIELGEIEVALARQEDVEQAVVVVRDARSGSRELVAWLVARPGRRVDPRALKEGLREALPEYMVPAFFATLDALPVTANGKVDRAALGRRDPPLPEGERQRHPAAPRAPSEELMAGIWAEVLGVEEVGIEDDFFALGGHSLLATRVVSRIRRSLGVDLPLRAVFEDPTVARLTRRVEGSAARELPPIAPAARGGPGEKAEPPLSFGQERLWLIHRLEPESSAYNVPGALRLSGALEVSRLIGALRGVVQRHEILRTRFPEVDGRAVQRVARHPRLRSPVVDLGSLDDAAREAQVRRLAAAEAARPFALARGPLVRTVLLRLADREHLLVFNLHHIVSDGWSMGILTRELVALYRGEPLPALELQYADFAVWQRRWLRGEVLDRQSRWWRERLDGAPRILELPLDRPRPPVLSDRGALLPFRLGRALKEDLEGFCRRRGLTLFMALLAGFQTLLARFASQEDLLVGSPVAGRHHAETEDLIGFFVNTLVLRGDLTGRPAWGPFLERVRETTLAAFAHQDLPFERLVDELQPRKDLSRAPLFQVLFAFQNAPEEELTLPGLTVKLEDVSVGTTKFDLSASVDGNDGQLSGYFEYSSELFDAATLRRLAEHFRSLLRGLVADPGRRIAEVDLLDGARRHQMLVEWNDTAALDNVPAPVHRLVEEQARRAPQALAVKAGDRELSYGELVARAGCLARRLRARGVGPDVRVAVRMERSPELVVALLAVLEAGGAYLPCDPDYPEDRLRFMLEDAVPPVVLTREDVPGPEDGEPLADASDEARVRPESLAYVIYTSGSTGRPKGVEVVHRGLSNLVRGFDVYSPLVSGDRVPQVSALSFDAMAFEIWPCLAAGASLHLFDPATLSDPARLVAALVRERITVAWLPTPLAEAVLALPWPERVSLRRMMTAGDRLRTYHRPELPFPLLNLYGPTENTVDATWQPVLRRPSPSAALPPSVPAAPPIGRPAANCRAYVLDRGLRPAPLGVPGELCLAGEGLARGYLGWPARTAEAFAPDPCAEGAGSRVYRTGDLARHLPAGNLEFLGRLDDQVKVRGFRIELGEIEAALKAQATVREVAVVAREDLRGDKALVAWMTPEAGAGAAGELRAALRARLPDYMIPAWFVFLPELPVTPNGKVDRRELGRRDPSATGDSRGESREAARTPAEELMAAIWAEVLGVEDVGRDRDFFELGGHSLLAARVISRIRRGFGLDLPLRAVFEDPTVARLTRRLDTAARSGLPPLEPVARRRDPPLSFAQERLWLLHRLAPRSPAYNLPAAVRLRGIPDLSKLKRAVNGIVRRHEVLRTNVREVEGRPSQVIAPSLELELPVVDLEALGAARQGEMRRLSSREGDRPFDLAHDPLIRMLVVRLAADDHLALFNMHHIVSDAWSMDVLVGELASLYRGRAPAVLPIQYADYAVWQRGWADGEVLDELLAWWREHLRGAPLVLSLPTDRPRPPVLSYRGAAFPLRVPPPLLHDLKGLSRRQGVTLFMSLLAGLQVLLSRYTHQRDVLVGSPVAGRHHAEVEVLIGFFVNTLVLRGDLSGDPPVGELLDRIRETTLGAYGHQDLAFGTLVDELQPERNLSSTPLFQVMLAFQNAGAAVPELPGLTSIPVPASTQAAKFDLSFSLAESPDGLAGEVVYPRDLFDASTVRRLARHWRSILAAAAADPQRRLSDLELLAPWERHQFLVEHNDTATPGDLLRPIHELFADRAEHSPEAVALVSGEEAWTFAGLRRRANRLARRLRDWGVGPESVVALGLEPSAELAAALLAVLQAGGAYLPLDPSWPAKRLAAVVSDAGVRILLTTSDLAGSFSELGSVRVLQLDAGEPATTGASSTPGVSMSGLAYVLYTSGSTGRPKGVMISHGSFANQLHWSAAVLLRPPADRLPVVTRSNFDPFGRQVFAPWLRGREVRMLDRELVGRPQALLAAIRHGRIRALNCVPSLWEAVVDAMEAPPPGSPEGRPETPVQGSRTAGSSNPKGAKRSARRPRNPGPGFPAGLLARLVLGSERLNEGLVARTRRLLPAVEICNSYGPTEVTINCSLATVTGPGRVTLGRPIHNTALYAADPGLRPVPPGAPGELTVAGLGLARGYLRRPALTAEKLVPHPWSREPGRRLYRSGDLVRVLPDGRIDFLGRMDHQAKIRGFRVELGEIESALGAHPSVKECVLTAPEDVLPGQQRLVAHVVAAPGATPAPGVLRAFLKKSLPDYMVPSAFVFLGALPRLAGGKVDRHRLPEPVATAARGAAPTDPTEEVLLEIWRDLLRVEEPGRIGLDDDFFELGGHSLLAVRLIARLQEAFGLELPLSAIFEGPTVRMQAAVLRRRGGEVRREPLVAIQPAGAHPPLFCVHPADGHVLCFSHLARLLGRDQPLYGLQARGLGPGEAPHRRIETMAAAYLEAIRSVQPRGPFYLLGYSLGGLVAYEMAQQLVGQGEPTALVAVVDVGARPRRPEESDPAPPSDAELLFETLGGELTVSAGDLRGLAPREQVALVAGRAVEAGLLPADEESATAQARRYIELGRAVTEARRAYRPRPYGGRVVLFRAADSDVLDESDDAGGWRTLAAPGLTLCRVPGTHRSVLSMPNVEVLASRLQEFLEEARGRQA